MKRQYSFRAYYGDNVKGSKKPGDLAIEVVYATRWLRDMEAALAAARLDIGVVVKRDPE